MWRNFFIRNQIQNLGIKQGSKIYLSFLILISLILEIFLKNILLSKNMNKEKKKPNKSYKSKFHIGFTSY